MAIETNADRLNKLLSNPLFLIIDMQNIYSMEQKWGCHSFDRALENILKLLNKHIVDNVIFTRYIAADAPKGVWKDYNRENAEANNDEWANEIVPELKQYTTEYPCYDKSMYSSYKIPELKKAAENASCVIVSGVVAECCVLSTVMETIDAGKYVIYLTDAVSGIDGDTESATIKVLDGLSPLHLSIMTTEELMHFLCSIF